MRISYLTHNVICFVPHGGVANGSLVVSLVNWLSALPLVRLYGFRRRRQAEIVTTAKQAIIVDYDSGETLFCKSCEEPMPPSSMSKLMTVELVFQRLKDGRLKPEDTFHVSETAWRQGQKDNESKMWVALNSDVAVDDLLKGIIVQSGGDACVVVAEALGGTESGFADMLNARAKEIGLTHSHFVNSSGLPDPGQFMSAEDLAQSSRPISSATIPNITNISRSRISPGARSASPTATHWSMRPSASMA